MVDPAAVRGRAWRGYADARRTLARSGSASSALHSFGRIGRSDVTMWTAATAEGHDRYRADHPVPTERIAVLCVSNRPHLLEDVVANVARQRRLAADLDVVFVANDPGFDMDRVELAFARFENATIDRAPDGTTLGSGLNRALRLTDARYVAKFDDDDRYGADFLTDMLRAHTYAGAGVVGKHSYYAYVAAADQTVLRFPAHEFTYTSTLAGGTLVIDRNIVDDQQFPDRSLGEDRSFIAQCHRRAISTFSADRFNFTQFRTGDNTWMPSTDEFLVNTIPVSTGVASSEIDR